MDKQGHLFPASIPTLLGNLLQLRHHAPPEFWQAYEKALYVHQWIGQPPEMMPVIAWANWAGTCRPFSTLATWAERRKVR